MSRPGDYDAVRKDIIAQLKKPDYDDGSAGPVFVRLAWHSAGTYDLETDTGGSNGAGMRYEAEGGDPPTPASSTAGPSSSPSRRNTPGSHTPICSPRGRLPDAAQGAEHLRAVFYRMGFNDQEIVALAGGHNLGRCHIDRSGFQGPWVNNPTRFSNQFFKLLLKLDWKPKTLPNGVSQFVYVDPDAEEGDEPLMMLPTDIALKTDPAFRVWVEKYADDKDLFFDHFAKAFAKLMELGIKRDENDRVINADNVKGGYISAPKKSNHPTGPAKGAQGGCPVAASQGGCPRAKL
ncbi:putative cytochrome c peroxidase [Aspergillus novofumigatus IBT 16806]|uniref:Peroxidase n=1 Tax=Aspergillus novofumigatus (strain IBT 16806) TaxID=1392255 RepID=A0A2I1CBG1_ASPN1|nr:putative cytochrome c peroxidase [Aspergillus novofumigatus IBT 16806]PKX94960.1 putative cytochrome c peroxidase [Aspergillus novofumigatus IBT 16806]